MTRSPESSSERVYFCIAEAYSANAADVRNRDDRRR
jgi:hypothetical protein